jgi:TolB-like protein/Flp pilus assembly protein TadD
VPLRSELTQFWAELNRRNVIRAAGAYVAISWLVVQIAQALLPAFGLGLETIRIVVILLAIGFLPLLIFAWVFEITPAGLKLEWQVEQGQSITRTTGRNLERIIIVALAAALTFFLVDWFILAPERQEAAVQSAFQEGQSKAHLESYGDRSIAVLPFVNMSGDKEQEFFADGISEELLNLLARVPRLRVISRSSSFAFKGQQLAAPEIARRLNVVHILEGSVRKSADKVRVSVQLIDARSDAHLWSITYDRPMDDIFAVQDEIAAQVVDRLKITLVEGAPRSRVTNTQAFTLYLEAKAIVATESEDAYALAVELLKQAVTLDPSFVAAWVELARTYSNQAGIGLRPFREGNVLAQEAIERARAVSLHDAGAVCTLAGIKMDVDHDVIEASRLVLEGLRTDPASETCLRRLSSLRGFIGRFEGSIEISNHLIERDPLTISHYINLAVTYMLAERWDDSLAVIARIRLISPTVASLNSQEAMLRLFRGKSGDAEMALSLVEREEIEGWRLYGLAVAHFVLGNHAQSDAALAQFKAKYATTWAYNIAEVSALRGEHEEAFKWLAKAIEVGDSGLAIASTDPALKSLRTDSRWLPFLTKIGQAPDQLAHANLDFTLAQSP